MAKHQSQPRIERVSSAANLSDGVSRNDFTVADEKNWFHMHLDLQSTYTTLLRAATNMDFAHNKAAALIYSDINDQVLGHLSQCPWGHDVVRRTSAARTFDGGF